jgi:opacity protein-like surface antigen
VRLCKAFAPYPGSSPQVFRAALEAGPNLWFRPRGFSNPLFEDATPMTTLVKNSTLILALGVAALPGMAFAGDMYNGAPGRMKDYGRAAVPVPPSNAYTEVYQYYVRGDIGLRFAGFPDASESGMNIGANDTTSPFGSDRFGAAHNQHAMIPGTVGAGVYLSPRFRADFTADLRQQSGADMSGTYSYTANKPSAVGSPVTFNGTTLGSTISGSLTDKLVTRSTVVMANAYYDLAERGRFTPYIGVGIGASANRIDREVAFGDESVKDPVSGVVSTRYRGSAVTDSQASWTLAAAAMTGITYNFDKRTSLDVNYRLQYIQGYDIVTRVQAPGSAAATDSRAKISDVFEHQLRAGVRVNLW